MRKAEKLLDNIYLIDDNDLSMKERTGTYVLTERDLTIVETSASPSVPYIIEGLKDIGYSPADLKYIIVTHIHLDHAGGAGLLLQECPNATVVVHPKGKRHLVEPSRLIAGARAVYGDKFDSLFTPILPIPEDRLIEMNNQDTLTLSDDCTLTFYDTPGHANHHFSIYHPKVQGMFTGDTCGIFYPQLFREGIEFYLPTTSPNQFDPSKMLKSIDLFKSLNLNYLFFGHYGMTSNPNEAYKQVSYWLNKFMKIARDSFDKGATFEKKTEITTKNLLDELSSYLISHGIQSNHDIYKILTLDMEVCAMGIVDYLYKIEKNLVK